MGAVVTEDMEPNCVSTIYASLRADGSTQARLFYDVYIYIYQKFVYSFRIQT